MSDNREKAFLYHTDCTSCGSSDALGVYEGGSGYCFSCETSYRGLDDVKQEEINDFEDETLELKPTFAFTSAVRGISPEIYTQYSYFKDKSGTHVIKHYNSAGEVVATKSRHKDKTFAWSGEAKEAVPFGMNLWRSGGKRIYITEGELDCLSVAQAIKGKYPVISINNGAQTAKKDLSKHIDFLNSYDEIILWFDSDKAGRKAVADVAPLFSPGKVKTIDSAPYKDANDILIAKGVAGVTKYYYEAKSYTPSGIVSGSSLDFDTVVDIDSQKSYAIPYPQLNKTLRGMRKGELVTFTAGSGIGKTTLVREIAYSMLTNENLKIGWVALEENTQRSALGFMSLHLDCPIYLEDERKTADKAKMKEAYDEVINTDNLYFYDHWGSLDSDALINKLRFLAVGVDCDFIFLDHISIVVSGGDNGDNERVAIDNLMTALRSLAEETHVGIGIISHLRRPGGDKGFENGTEITLSHLRGSGGIAQLSDAVVALERNQQSEDRANIANIRVLKNRYTGETGVAGAVTYDIDTGRLRPCDLDDEEFKDETDDF